MRALAALLEAVADDPDAPTTVRAPADGGRRARGRLPRRARARRPCAAAREIADLGSGAGFPGLALAAALPAARVRLVESAARKCAFLRAR